LPLYFHDTYTYSAPPYQLSSEEWLLQLCTEMACESFQSVCNISGLLAKLMNPYVIIQALPPHVDAEIAVKEGWWKDPDYILYELNINSTISSPGHDERILLSQDKLYTIKGYAYSGGGRKITRVELSFDGGEASHISCSLAIPLSTHMLSKRGEHCVDAAI
jgi:hypothetical protein